MMRNDFITNVSMTRHELCDLLLTCTLCEQRAKSYGNTGESWTRLHSKLKEQLDFLDGQLDEFAEFILEE